MLCCLGLFAGLIIGSTLGGPWFFTAPAVGFGLGLLLDVKLMRSNRGRYRFLIGGCCGSGHSHSERVLEGTRDPVCGMKVDRRTAKYKTEFEGETYYFCSRECMSTFKENPRMYVG